ncbi:MAG: cupin domain-containing protein [Immundisolibacter sp.]|uniref:cupin domain-containing protein n=1 Tax=Immundisolibacter sp. TaxID=1934948 RepID=UPI003EDF6DC5
MRKTFYAAILAAALPCYAVDAAPAVDPRTHPGEVRVLDMDTQALTEVVPDTVYMRHWFGTNLSVALFRIEPGNPDAARPAMHSHGTELGVQLAGGGTMVDEFGRSYVLRSGDVMLIKSGVKHSGDFGDSQNVILSVVTPPRPEYQAEDGAPYFPGSGSPAAAPAPSLEGDQGAPVRVLFNLNDVTKELTEIVPGQLYFKHWHGDDVTVSVTRMVRTAGGHFPGKVNVHGEEVALAVKGSLDMIIDGKPHHVAEGQVLIIPPQVPHTGACLDDECLLVSWFTPNRVAEWGPEGNATPDLRFLDKK